MGARHPADAESTGFGAAVRRLRESAGWTRDDLSAECGVSVNGLLKLENGEREPAWPTALKIAAALGVTPNDLMPCGPPPAGGVRVIPCGQPVPAGAVVVGVAVRDVAG